MKKRNARLVLGLIFVAYLLLACAPPFALLSALRVWASGGQFEILWWGRLDEIQELIILALNIILVWAWSGYAMKIIHRLTRGPRERAHQALKGGEQS